MCGIAGFVGSGDRNDLIAMTSAQVHRGPDENGYYVDNELPVFLGHQRLSIRDAAGGTQPMWNEDNTVCVIFNGEIYNHVELRRELESYGHKFRSDHSDTEVLVHGYEQWGAGLAVKLNGMFAFVVFDSRRKRLLLARDRFGEKPLYYYKADGVFAFASELSALIRHTAVPAKADLAAVRKFFAWGYIPTPAAYYEGSAKLPAGHTLELDLSSQAASVKPYWRFRIEPDSAFEARSEASLVEELRHLLLQAVERRMVSDVPLGVFLSGGIDSSLIAAAAAQKHPPESIKAFTIGFFEKSFDESDYAKAVASHLGIDHKLKVLHIDMAKDLIPSVLSRLDEPLGDPSIVPTYLLAQFAREQVTVALSGDGGDELFAGYDPFAALGPAQIYMRVVPDFLHRLFRALAEHLPHSHRNMSFDFKVRRMLLGLSYPQSVWAPAWMAPLEPELHRELFESHADAEELYEDAKAVWESCASADPADRLMEFFTVFYLQDDILTKTDRATMMNSLESRAIFLDNDLVEFCRRLPRRFKIRNGERKYLLRRVAETLLPHEIVERPKKGFGIPIGQWLKSVPAEPPLRAVPGVSTDWVRQAWREHRLGQADHRLFLWSWLSMQYCGASPSLQPTAAPAPMLAERA
jgi:asparagine synthase (glutamine-hydrolysing)